MGMDDVVLDPFTQREEHTGPGEVGNQGKQVILVNRRAWADIEIDDPCARRDLLDCGPMRIGSSGEYINRYASLRDMNCQVTDIDIHPTSVFAAECRHGAGVHRYHGNSPGKQIECGWRSWEHR